MIWRIKKRLLLLRWWMHHFSGRQLRRWSYKLSRPPSDPYVSGDGFRRLAGHLFDETHRGLLPGAVKDGDIVFATTYHVKRFIEEVDPLISSNYRLITHNSDLAVDEDLGSRIPDRVLAWYAQNATHAHPRIVPIPIGLENLHHYHAGIPGEFDAIRMKETLKKSRILAAFAIRTNPAERDVAFRIAQQAVSADLMAGWPAQAVYMESLSSYKFVLSPPGNGLDTHRTWEAMYLGVVPIVKDSVAARSFRARGLPLWIIGSWEELLSLSEGDLEAKYAELKGGFDSPALYMDYWRDLIRGTPEREAPAGQEQGAEYA